MIQPDALACGKTRNRFRTERDAGCYQQEAGMDSGLTIRPIAGSAEAAYVRLEPAAVRAAVATTLAPSQTVTAANDSARSAAHDPARNGAAQTNVTREFVLDPQSREVIFRVIDVRTGQVQRQVPDAALMRMRAYTRAMANGKSPLDAASDTDNTA